MTAENDAPETFTRDDMVRAFNAGVVAQREATRASGGAVGRIVATNPYALIPPAVIDKDCTAVGFSGEGRCIEPALRDGLCAEHLED